jgi:hypothetical protein
MLTVTITVELATIKKVNLNKQLKILQKLLKWIEQKLISSVIADLLTEN